VTLSSAAFLFFLVLDPLGNIPFFLTALRNVDARRHRRIIARELLIALAILLFFLFAGRYVLVLLAVSPPSLRVAGGVILFLIALRMVFPTVHGFYEHVEGEPFVVPLAVPYVAGPSAIATTLLLTSQAPDRWPEWLAAVVLAWAATGAILLGAATFHRVLGQRGLIAVERLMGMLLTVVAVEMFLSGVRMWLSTPALAPPA
jgi:MarC family membrane protein